MLKKLIFSYISFFILIPNIFGQLQPALLGEAANLGNDCYLITPDAKSKSGAIWYQNAIDFTEDFEIVFDAYFGVNDANGADGMALVFKTTATPELGGLGGGLGYAGISPSLVLEFDTWQNNKKGKDDPVSDHIGLMPNGNPLHSAGLAIATFPNLEDGETYEIKFAWSAASKTIIVTKDCVEIISFTGDIVNLTLGGNTKAYFGFTGSTGGSTNEQRICFKHISFVEGLQDLDICKGDIVNTVDATFSEATHYSWTPTIGISDPSVPNPIFSPNTTTTYQVAITEKCGNIYTENFTINVYDAPSVLASTIITQCDDGMATLGFSTFNLTEANDEISTNATNETFIYFLTQATAISGDITSPDYINNPTAFVNRTENFDTVWARIENTLGCASISQIQLQVSTKTIPSDFLATFTKCDDFLDINGADNPNNDDRDGVTTFDFSSADATILSLISPGQKPRYFRNEADARAEVSEITDISNYRNIGYSGSQYIYVYIDNGCLDLGAHILLNVESLPVANPVSIARVCDDDNDGIFSFNTAQIENDVLGSQNPSDVIIEYTYIDYTDIVEPIVVTNSLPNPFITASQVVAIRVANITSPALDEPCYDETTLEFFVDDAPFAFPVAPFVVCDGSSGDIDDDKLFPFDTSNIESTILGSQTNMDVFYTYQDENGTLMSNIRSLPNPLISGSQTIAAEVVNPINLVCTASTTIGFVVNSLPSFDVEANQPVCSSNIDFSKELEIIKNNFTEEYNYEWRWTNLDGSISEEFISNDEAIIVSDFGTYSITLSRTDGRACSSRTREIFVSKSEKPIITNKDVTVNSFSTNNSVIINAANVGKGSYQYALKEEKSTFINYQREPVFNNIEPGFYTLYVKDEIDENCVSALDISVMGYPKYFTPNSDGVNDFWRIKGIKTALQSNSTVLIYNRYGKLLKELFTKYDGWDGTFNGALMEADDYWFKVYLQDGRTFMGHFTLKR